MTVKGFRGREAHESPTAATVDEAVSLKGKSMVFNCTPAYPVSWKPIIGWMVRRLHHVLVKTGDDPLPKSNAPKTKSFMAKIFVDSVTQDPDKEKYVEELFYKVRVLTGDYSAAGSSKEAKQSLLATDSTKGSPVSWVSFIGYCFKYITTQVNFCKDINDLGVCKAHDAEVLSNERYKKLCKFHFSFFFKISSQYQ